MAIRDIYDPSSRDRTTPISIGATGLDTIDDNLKSTGLKTRDPNILITPSSVKINENDTNPLNNVFDQSLHSNGLRRPIEIDLFDEYYRFGLLAPNKTLHTVKEYLFFTKPDLNIYPRVSAGVNVDKTKVTVNTGVINQTISSSINPVLAPIPYWQDLSKNYPKVIQMLQDSLCNDGNHFNHLLANCVQNNLSIPGLSAEMIDTPNNTYGVGFTYRGSSESSDDNFDFTLEFKDTKNLDVYHFFRAYEEYETLKHHGILKPWDQYIRDRVLYDQYSIYKFLVDEDGETIVYYAQLFGVKSKSLPRDVFESTTFDNGVSYSIDFNAAFYDDMNPNIIRNFNSISKSYFDTLPYRVDVYNEVLDAADNRAVQAAYITEEYKDDPECAGGKRRVYKLRWKGSETV